MGVKSGHQMDFPLEISNGHPLGDLEGFSWTTSLYTYLGPV